MQGNVKEISDKDLMDFEALVRTRQRLKKKLNDVQVHNKLIKESNENCYHGLPEYKSLESEYLRLSDMIRQVSASIKKNKKKRIKIKINAL